MSAANTAAGAAALPAALLPVSVQVKPTFCKLTAVSIAVIVPEPPATTVQLTRAAALHAQSSTTFVVWVSVPILHRPKTLRRCVVPDEPALQKPASPVTEAEVVPISILDAIKWKVAWVVPAPRVTTTCLLATAVVVCAVHFINGWIRVSHFI